MAQDDPSRGKESKQRILESAIHLFAQKGYDGASVRDVLERAGRPDQARPLLLLQECRSRLPLKQSARGHFAISDQKCDNNAWQGEDFMKASLAETIDRARSLSLFVQEDTPHLIFRLEAAEKIQPSDPGFLALLERVYRALKMDRPARESEVVDLWALDLWEYNQKEYDYFSRHPEMFTGFSECGITRILSHVALTLDLGDSAYLFVMYNVAKQRIDLRSEIEKEDYEVFLEALPF